MDKTTDITCKVLIKVSSYLFKGFGYPGYPMMPGYMPSYYGAQMNPM